MKLHQLLAAKECPPSETIIRIKNILSQLSIKIYEKSHYHPINNCYSSRLVLNDLPEVGTNGKGLTEELCMASAYGELLERLQNESLLGTTPYGQKDDPFHIKPNNTCKPKDLLKSQKSLVQNILGTTDKAFLEVFESKNIELTEYFNTKTSQFESLPKTLINFSILSNGMCAGNTMEEALVQGISEIFERYLNTNIQRGAFKDIQSISIEEIVNPILLKTINKMLSLGYNIMIKDCTLGGRYPVTAIIYSHEKSRKYSVVFGAHPVFDIALQRCITEAFQGIASTTPDTFLRMTGFLNLNDDSEIRKEVLSATKNGRGKFPKEFITSEQASSFVYKNAFVENSNNKNLLEHLVGILKRENHTLYIRDVSFLGFPSFQLYIPGVSEITKLSSTDLYLIANQKRIRRLLLNLKTLSVEEAKELFDILRRALSDSIFSGFRKDILAGYCNIFCGPNSDIGVLLGNYYFLLAQLAFRIKDHKMAAKYLADFIKEAKDISDDDRIYYQCACDYFLKKDISKNYPNELVSEVTDNLSYPDKAFDAYDLDENHHYNNWLKLKIILEEKKLQFQPPKLSGTLKSLKASQA